MLRENSETAEASREPCAFPARRCDAGQNLLTLTSLHKHYISCHTHTPSKFLKMFALFLSNLITCLDCSKASVNLNFINHTLFLEQENEGPIKLRDLIVT